jgi:hypothetical protein
MEIGSVQILVTDILKLFAIIIFETVLSDTMEVSHDITTL